MPSRRNQPDHLIWLVKAGLLFGVLAVVGCVSVPTLARAEETAPEVPLHAIEGERSGSLLTDPEAAVDLPHSDLDRTQVLSLLEGVFEPVLQSAAGPFDDLSVEELIGQHAAIISSGERPEPSVLVGTEEEDRGSSELLFESTLPISEGGEVVDLSLENTGSSLQPMNPLVQVQMPQHLGGGIELPESHAGIELVDAPADRAPSSIDSVVVYPNVATDTDLLVAPTPQGVEVMTTLRTPDAPPSRSFRLDLGEGGQLQEREDGSARLITGNGETALIVRQPSAIDAAGANVPVRMAVAGDEVTVTAEPDEKTKYPVLVDPLIESFSLEGGTSSNNWGFPGWESITDDRLLFAQLDTRPVPEEPGGLEVLATGSGSYYTPGDNVHWFHAVPRYRQGVQEQKPPTSYISGFTLSGIHTRGSAGTSSPYMYAGIWDPPLNRWAGTGPYAVWGREGNLPNIVGGSISFTAGGDKQAQIAQGPGFDVNENASMNGEREWSAAGASVEIGDDEPPEVELPSVSSAWSNQTAQSPLSATVNDSGLGAKSAEFGLPGQSTVKVTNSGCTGTATSPCPAAWRATLAPSQYNSTVMPQGWLSIPIWGQDVLGRRSSSPALAEVGIDHTAPALSPVAGSLTEQATLGTHKAQYNLKFSATDGFEPPASLQKSITGGSLSHPVGIVVDKSGNVWVVDRDHNQVKKFNQAGELIGTIGKAGPGNGELLEPRMIAVDGSGNLWVTDMGNHRIEEFSPSGAYIRQFKSETLANPYGIAIDPSGAIWVTDIYANEVVKITESGGSLAIALRVKGEKHGNTDTTFQNPSGLAVDSSGNIWVADKGHDQLQELSSAGVLIRKVGSTGSTAGQFHEPYGIAVTGLGHLLVSDAQNHRVQLLDTQGDFLRMVGTGTGQYGLPTEIANGSGNTAFVVDTENNRVQKWENVDLDSQSGVVGSEVLVDGTSRETFKPACSGQAVCAINSHEWVLKASEFSEGVHSVQVTVTDGVGLKTSSQPLTVGLQQAVPPQLNLNGTLTEQATLGNTRPRYILNAEASPNGSYEGQPTFVTAFGATGSGTGQLNGPRGVAADGKGHVWVVDRVNNRVEEFDEAGNYISQFGTAGTGNGQFTEPWGIAVTPAGNLWVADSGNQRLQEFSSEGKFIQKFGTKAGAGGSKGTEYISPEDIALAPGGMLWVTDSGGDRLAEFRENVSTESERWVRDTTGTKPTEPAGLAVDASGNVLVADEEGGRVLEYSPEGAWIKTIGVAGTGNGQLSGPTDVAVSAAGNLYVVDSYNNRVEVFNAKGEYLTKFGTAGTGNGQFSEPKTIAFGAGGAIFVTDKGHNRVHKWTQIEAPDPIASIEVKVDGKAVTSSSGRCNIPSCRLASQWTLNSTSYLGSHVVTVTATSTDGYTTTKTLNVNELRDETKPTIKISGELASAPEGWVQQKSYGFTASGADPSGYGVTSLVLKIDGAAVASATNGCSDGGCEAAFSKAISMAAYRGGAHTAEVVATDGAGNVATKAWTINVDPQGAVPASEATATLEAMEETVPVEEEFKPVSSTAEVLEPEIIAGGDNPGLGWDQGTIISSGVTTVTEVDPGTGAVTIEGAEGPLELTPESQTGQAQVVEGSAAMIPGSSGSTDTIVRPEYNGGYMFTTIRGSSDPEEYVWKVHLNPGQHLVQYDEQHVQVIAKTGAEAWLITANHARDATGKGVPTSVSIVGESGIAFHIQHRGAGFVYPISAGESYETSYALVTANLIEELPEEPAFSPPPGGHLTEAEARELLTTRAMGPEIIPAPEPAGGGSVAIASSVPEKVVTPYKVCAASCNAWHVELKNPSYHYKKTEGGLATAYWQAGTQVHSNWWYNGLSLGYYDVAGWGCGLTGPGQVWAGQHSHLTAWGRYAITVHVTSNGQDIPQTLDLGLQIWVWPNGVQQRVRTNFERNAEAAEAAQSCQ